MQPNALKDTVAKALWFERYILLARKIQRLGGGSRFAIRCSTHASVGDKWFRRTHILNSPVFGGLGQQLHFHPHP